MSTRTGSRHSRDDVVRTAVRLFAERGFHGTSMRDLGDALGLLGSSLYAHIGSKSELLVEITREGAELFQSLADKVLASELGPEQRLAELVAGHVGIITDHLDLATTLFNETRHLPEPERSEVVALRDRYQDAFRQVLADGVAVGVFRPGLDSRLSATLVLSLLNALDRWYRPDGGATPAEVAEELTRFVLAGVAA